MSLSQTTLKLKRQIIQLSCPIWVSFISVICVLIFLGQLLNPYSSLFEGFSVPVDVGIHVDDKDISISWEKPNNFGDICKYTVEAISGNETFSQKTETTKETYRYYRIGVKFSNLTLGTNFAFYIDTQCEGSEIQRIKVGEMETNPGTPGVPQDPQLILSDPKTVNFTWNPPAVFRGKRLDYKWSCRTEDGEENISGRVEENYVIIKDFPARKFFCIVKAASFTPGYDDMNGNNTNKTFIEIPSHGEHCSIFFLFAERYIFNT